MLHVPKTADAGSSSGADPDGCWKFWRERKSTNIYVEKTNISIQHVENALTVTRIEWQEK